MRIALITPYDYTHPGGVTEHVRHLDRAFRAHGHETRIIAPSSRPQSELEPHVIRVHGGVMPLQVNGSMARIALSPFIDAQIKTILAQEQFDVVHVHEPAVPLVSLMALAHSQGVTVGTFHALVEGNKAAEAVYPLAMWPILEWLDGRVFVSLPLRDSVASFFPGEHRIIPNGIDTAAFSGPDIQPVAAFNDGRPNLLFVGRMEARKGFRHLLRAYPYVKHALPDVRLLVVGAYSAEETARFVRYASYFRLGDIHFIGRVSQEELPRYYRTATLFCAPSTGSESFGIVLLEAMAAGVPIVASDIAGYRSVLTPGVEGCLVEPGNEKALADTISGLLRDPDTRHRMAALGQSTARRYDWACVAPRVLDYYTELIAARAAQPISSEEKWQRIASRLQQEARFDILGEHHRAWLGQVGVRVNGVAEIAIGSKVIFRLALG